jgi:hypothetical protein
MVRDDTVAMTLTRRTIRWFAIGLNLAAACYYGVAFVRFLLAFDRPFSDLVGFLLSFHGLVFFAGFVAPALAVTALLVDSRN